jgi:hypothetical protein
MYWPLNTTTDFHFADAIQCTIAKGQGKAHRNLKKYFSSSFFSVFRKVHKSMSNAASSTAGN